MNEIVGIKMIQMIAKEYIRDIQERYQPYISIIEEELVFNKIKQVVMLKFD